MERGGRGGPYGNRATYNWKAGTTVMVGSLHKPAIRPGVRVSAPFALFISEVFFELIASFPQHLLFNWSRIDFPFLCTDYQDNKNTQNSSALRIVSLWKCSFNGWSEYTDCKKKKKHVGLSGRAQSCSDLTSQVDLFVSLGNYTTRQRSKVGFLQASFSDHFYSLI